MGRLSYQAMVVSHSGQNERTGLITDMSRGKRNIQTLRKLPMISPKSAAKSASIKPVPFHTQPRFLSPSDLQRNVVPHGASLRLPAVWRERDRPIAAR